MVLFILPNNFDELKNFMVLRKKLLGTLGDAINIRGKLARCV
jgi:hypothetical protein